MVATTELKVDVVTRFRCNLLGVKYKASRPDGDSDVDGRNEGRNKSGDKGERRGGGELHGAE